MEAGLGPPAVSPRRSKPVCASIPSVRAATNRYKTNIRTVTVYGPFHLLRGHELQVVGTPRNGNTAITVVAPTGRRHKIPLWIVSPAAAGYVMGEQATVNPQALLLAFELLLPVMSNASQLAGNLSATGTSPTAGGADEATRPRVVTRTHLTRLAGKGWPAEALLQRGVLGHPRDMGQDKGGARTRISSTAGQRLSRDRLFTRRATPARTVLYGVVQPYLESRLWQQRKVERVEDPGLVHIRQGRAYAGNAVPTRIQRTGRDPAFRWRRV